MNTAWVSCHYRYKMSSTNTVQLYVCDCPEPSSYLSPLTSHLPLCSSIAGMLTQPLVMFSFPLLMLFIWLYLFFFYFFFNNSPVIYLFCTYFFSVSLLLCNFGLFVGSNFLFAEEHTLEVSFLKSDTSELKFG